MVCFVTLLRLFALVLLQDIGTAWKSCSEDTGGGTCPDETTCCPTETPGVSACIPLVHANGPFGAPKGRCCGGFSFNTGCRFGYECAVSVSTSDLFSEFRESTEKTRFVYRNQNQKHLNNGNCKATNETLAFDPSARDTYRYDLCRIPEEATKLYGIPISRSPNRTWDGSCTKHDNKEETGVFHLPYFSNVGSIAVKNHSVVDDNRNDSLETVERAVILVHGSLRDAEDYFCSGLSLIQGDNSNNYTNNTTIIIAPKFASVNDNMEEYQKEISSNKFLVWNDQAKAYDDLLWHTWRYGANAANAPISSYTALDYLLEHLVENTARFPNLQHITITGHSGTYNGILLS